MGLRDHAAKFEAEDDVSTTTVEKETATMTTTTAPSAEAAASTAIATAKSTAVGAARKFVVAYADKKDAMPTEMVAQFGRVAPSVTAEQGSLKLNSQGQKTKLGKKIRARVVSFNDRWLVTPGVMDKEAKEKVRSSYDKENLDDYSATVTDYLNGLKAEGYDKARLEPYIDLWVDIVWSEADGDVPVEKQQLTRCQLSKTSAGNFSYFCGNRGRLESMGLAEPSDLIEIHCEDLEGKNGSYSNMSFHAVA